MPEPTMTDIAKLAALSVGICFAFIFLLSFILQFIVALKSTPARRAIWTVAPPLLVVVLGMLIWGPEVKWGLWLPVAALPAAILAFVYWYLSFRRAWIEDPENLPEGASLSNDDWKIGLGIVLLVLALNFAKNFFLASF